MVIVDSHIHFGIGNPVMVFDETAEGYLTQSDFTGCTYMVQSFMEMLDKRPCLDNIDERCQELYEQSGKRVFSLLVFNPNYAKECLEIIEECHDRPYIVGIKLHPSDHSVWADDEAYRSVWELADKYHLPIMSHSWALTSNPKQKYATPERFEKYIREYPNVKFIFGHSGGRVPGIKTVAELGAKYPNVHFDIAGDVYNRKLIEYLTKKAGVDRLLLASDMGWFDLSFSIGMVLGSDLTLEEKEMVLGGNAVRVFGLEELI